MFAVLYVWWTMGLTRCYKTEAFLHLYFRVINEWNNLSGKIVCSLSVLKRKLDNQLCYDRGSKLISYIKLLFMFVKFEKFNVFKLKFNFKYIITRYAVYKSTDSSEARSTLSRLRLRRWRTDKNNQNNRSAQQ